MKCPFCQDPNTAVKDTRPTNDGQSIRRRRECIACGARFTTYEVVETRSKMVVKKDGTREVFQRTKMLNGMIKSCEKRPVSVEVLEQAALDIENHLESEFKNEIPTVAIGESVMRALREIDKVAYVRFASVYREFEDVGSFYEELRKLEEPDQP